MTTSVVWVTGPPGVGKSTAGWTVYLRALARGEPVAYLDVDQVANMQPDPDGDPDRLRLGLTGATAVIANFSRVGHARVIVSGVMDPAVGVGSVSSDVVSVRLRCDPDELVRRYLGRTGNVQSAQSVRDEAAAYDRSTVCDLVVDTTARHPSEVMGVIEAAVPAVGAPPNTTAVEPVPVAIPGFLLVGPPGVGLSTIGWALASTWWRAGVRVGFVDVDQLGFTDGRDATALTAANLAAVAAAHCDVGATALVAVARGPLVTPYAQVLPDLDVVRVTADEPTLASRIAERAAGGGPNLAGSDLRGLSGPQQAAAVTRSVHVAQQLAADGVGRQVDTSGRTVDEIVTGLRTRRDREH